MLSLMAKEIVALPARMLRDNAFLLILSQFLFFKQLCNGIELNKYTPNKEGHAFPICYQSVLYSYKSINRRTS